MEIERRLAILKAAMEIGRNFVCSGEVFWKGEWYDIKKAIDSGDLSFNELGKEFSKGACKSLKKQEQE